jgi:hypothetical protein
MGQVPLVSERIEAGKAFLDAREKHMPVKAAFWLKASEDSGWYLHVVSDQVSDGKIREAYGVVGDVSTTILDPNFDLFRVKLIGGRDPLARAAVEIHRRSPARRPTWIHDGPFGGMSVEGVYVYPPPVSPVSK